MSALMTCRGALKATRAVEIIFSVIKTIVLDFLIYKLTPKNYKIMLHFSLIGNLGADAEVKNFSSGDYVVFRVAHNFREGDKERTQWVSCYLKGSGGKLLDYLKKGASVFVCGRGAARTFSSQITKQFEVGLDIQVDRLELVSTQRKITLEAIKSAMESGEVNWQDVSNMINELPI